MILRLLIKIKRNQYHKAIRMYGLYSKKTLALSQQLSVLFARERAKGRN